jgi:AraC-like DNA-binding protein
MKDFAAAAMVRLVRRGLQREGLAADPPAPSTAAGALVALQDKRRLLEALLQQHGPALLLRLGQAVHGADDEPTLTALTEARSAPDLIARWQRLERFVHSRHRVLTLALTDTACTLRHVSLRAGEAPTAAEDLLVFGLLVALLQRLGTAGLRARFAGESRWRHREGRWAETHLPAAMDAATWELAWQAPVETSASAPVPSGAATPDAARAVLAADCAAPWTLPRLAETLGLAPRTLQRRLTEAGTSFSCLWTEVRLAQSARMLVGGREPMAQVGYLCGFADQAHFTRSFKRFTAMTPVVYRAQFGSAAPATH